MKLHCRLQSDVTGESVLIREGKPSEVIRYITDYRLQMIWYIYFMSDMDTRGLGRQDCEVQV